VFAPTPKGQLNCLDAATGKQLWQTDKVTELNTGASIHLTAIAGSNCVFLFTDRGDLLLARLTAAGYQEISRAHLIEPTNEFGARKMAWTPPAYANGCVFLRNDKEVICASLRAKPQR
jgi:outer membrane protein assembly factor BamB